MVYVSTTGDGGRDTDADCGGPADAVGTSTKVITKCKSMPFNR